MATALFGALCKSLVVSFTANIVFALLQTPWQARLQSTMIPSWSRRRSPALKPASVPSIQGIIFVLNVPDRSVSQGFHDLNKKLIAVSKIKGFLYNPRWPFDWQRRTIIILHPQGTFIMFFLLFLRWGIAPCRSYLWHKIVHQLPGRCVHFLQAGKDTSQNKGLAK